MPKAEPSLAGLRVVITRPRAQAGALADMVREAGGEPVLFPTLEIVPVEPPADQVEACRRAGMLVFVSANAAAHGAALAADNDGSQRLVAIGEATRKALTALGHREVLSPAAAESSTEALIREPFMRGIGGSEVCIVRGEGGREALREVLEERGARVCYLECYRRQAPAGLDTEALAGALEDARVAAVITVTSNAGLDNLLLLTPNGLRQRLKACPLVVIAERQRAAALDHGWLGPVLVAGAGDRRIVDAIAGWRVKTS